MLWWPFAWFPCFYSDCPRLCCVALGRSLLFVYNFGLLASRRLCLFPCAPSSRRPENVDCNFFLRLSCVPHDQLFFYSTSIRSYLAQARWNGLKVGWDISIWWSWYAPDGLNRVKVASKIRLGQIPSVPLCSAGPVVPSKQVWVGGCNYCITCKSLSLISFLSPKVDSLLVILSE